MLNQDINVTEGDLLEVDQFFRLKLGIKLREMGYREKAMILFLDALRVDEKFMPARVNLAKLRLDYDIFMHKEKETFFE